jgi:CxxC motif-containing protein
MRKQYTCIICPNGCEIAAQITGTQIMAMEGASCNRGKEYVEQELIDPQRNIATSVLVEAGILPLVSVRLTRMIPKNRIVDVMTEIKKITLVAPVAMKQIVIKNVLGLNSDVIATKIVSAQCCCKGSRSHD